MAVTSMDERLRSLEQLVAMGDPGAREQLEHYRRRLGFSTYQVWSWNLEFIQTQVAKMAKRAERLGLIPPALEINGTVAVKHPKGAPRPDLIAYSVSLRGEAPRLPGWEFVAVLEHVGRGATIVRQVPLAQVRDGELEPYRSAAAWCAHCNTVRNRNDTYVVRSEKNGKLVQVGSSCLRDYLGHDDPHALAKLAEELCGLARSCGLGWDDELGFGSRQPRGWPVVTYLAEVSAAIRESGWLSRGKARGTSQAATADVAWSSLVDKAHRRTRDSRGRPCVCATTDEDHARARRALETGRRFLEERAASRSLSDYEHNLRVTLGLASETDHENFEVTERMAGIAASLLSYVDRECEQRAAAAREQFAARDSMHMGQVGERLDVHVEIISRRTFNGNFGPRTVVNMASPDGDRLVWWSSGYPEDTIQAGHVFMVSGTVRDHVTNARNGARETVLRRCMFRTLEEWQALTGEHCRTCAAEPGQWCRNRSTGRATPGLHKKRQPPKTESE